MVDGVEVVSIEVDPVDEVRDIRRMEVSSFYSMEDELMVAEGEKEADVDDADDVEKKVKKIMERARIRRQGGDILKEEGYK